MRIVGGRKEHPITLSASAAMLREGARFNDQMHLLPTGSSTFIPKGVFFFRTHADANAQQQECLVGNIVQVASERV